MRALITSLTIWKADIKPDNLWLRRPIVADSFIRESNYHDNQLVDCQKEVLFTMLQIITDEVSYSYSRHSIECVKMSDLQLISD
ncbi:hypothetical protein ND16A_2912 [Thalassotalea sp. ND16A]|nr:hypothetical protein ND16A_2912 [Thalassotalea sp. ND16A]